MNLRSIVIGVVGAFAGYYAVTHFLKTGQTH